MPQSFQKGDKIIPDEIDIANADPETRHEYYKQQAACGKRWCYDCMEYQTSHFCGYTDSSCKIHESLDIDQKLRHPCVTADTCPDYKNNGQPHWFE